MYIKNFILEKSKNNNNKQFVVKSLPNRRKNGDQNSQCEIIESAATKLTP